MASKAGFETLWRVAQTELRRPVTVVEPPAVSTALWQRLEQSAARDAITPEAAESAILEGFSREAVSELLL